MDILNHPKVKVVNGFIYGFNRRYISTFAANGAFFMFLSLFPLTILISYILPLTGLDAEQMLELMSGFVPEPMTALMEQIIHDIYGGSVAILSLSVLVTLWSSAKALAAVIKGVEMITGDLDSDFYLKRRLRASLYTLVMLLAVLVSLLLVVFGERIAGMAVAAFPRLEQTLNKMLSERYFSTFFLLTAFFLLLYHAVPRNPERWRHLLPGALFSSLSWMLFSWLFSLYVSYSGSSSIYGRLATLVLAMLWMYYVIYLLLIGAWLNEYLAILRRGVEPPAPVLPKWALRLLQAEDSAAAPGQKEAAAEEKETDARTERKQP